MKAVAAAVLFAFVLAGTARAVDAPRPPAPSPKPAPKPSPKPSAKAPPAPLTTAQIKQMGPALKDAKSKVKEIAAKPRNTEADRQARMKELQGLAGDLKKAAQDAGITDEQVKKAVQDKLKELNIPPATPAPTPSPTAAPQKTELEKFKDEIGEVPADLAAFNKGVTGTYRMRYETGRVTTNLNGRDETMTIYRLQGMKIGEKCCVPPTLVEDIKKLPDKSYLSSKGVDLEYVQGEVKSPGAANPRTNAFLIAQEGTIKDEAWGEASFAALSSGGLLHPGTATTFSGTLTFKVRVTQDDAPREWYIKVPFSARKIAP